jgi:hypothetical protein
VKKAIFLTAITIFGYLNTSMVFAEEMTFKAVSENEWQMFDQLGNLLGALKRTAKGTFKLYNKRGRYAGEIFKSGNWKPQRRHHSRITPQAAQLYLNALKVIERIE